MIHQVNQFCNKINKKLGISLTLSSPNRKTLKAFMIVHGVIGASLLIIGAVFRFKWCMVLGMISMISSIILRKETVDEKNS